MDLNLDDTQSDIQRAFGALFEHEVPTSRVRAAEPLGFDRELWNTVANAGAVGMAVAESVGGGGGGLLDLALVVEQFGRHIAPIPLVEAAVAARALARYEGSPADVMKGALSGDLIVTLAPRPAQGTSHLLVPGGAVANYLLTLSDDDLTLVPMGDPSSRVHVANLGSGPIADCSASGEAIVLDRGESARAAFDRMLDEWKTLTSIALVGLAARAHEIAIDHVQFRQIFGLPLGSFQSVAHRLAEAIVQIDGARFLSYEAAWSIDHEIPQVGAFASAAFAYCSETAFKTASIALHLHGGVGYTVEHDIQLFYRRAKAWPLILGDPSREYERVADIIWSRE